MAKLGLPHMRFSVPYLLLAAAFVALLFVLVSPWLRSNQRFPTLPPGAYVGTIRGLESSTIPIYVRRAVGQDDVLFTGFSEGWKPQVLSAMVRAGDEWELPLIVHGPAGTWQLVGKESEPLRYSGKISATQGAVSGTWELYPAVDVPVSLNSEVGDFRLLLSLRGELEEAELARKQAEESYTSQKTALDSLLSFMNDKGAMQASVEEKFKLAQAEFAGLRANLEQRLKAVSQAEEQLQVAQRVTAAGKLVALGRESLEREARWAETMLRTSSESVTEGLGEAVARGREILEIKRQIEGEKNAIFRLKFLGTEAGPSDVAVAQP